MDTHPFVLLVEPDPLLRELIHGELKDHGCIVFDAACDKDALAFAEVYPGAIDLALTDLHSAQEAPAFAHSLRALPTGAATRIVHMAPAVPGTPSGDATYLMKPFDRTTLLDAVRKALPRSSRSGGSSGTSSRNTETRRPDRAVFWGAGREAADAAVG